MKTNIAFILFCVAYLILGSAVRFYEALAPMVSGHLEEGALCLINLVGLVFTAIEMYKTRLNKEKKLPPTLLVLVYAVSFLLFDGSVSNVLGDLSSSLAVFNYRLSIVLLFTVGFSVSAHLLLLLNCLFSIYTVAAQIGFFPDITLVSILFGVSTLLFSFRIARFFESSISELFSAKNFVVWLNFSIGLIYFLPGVGKIVISPTGTEWMMENSLTNLIFTACNFNWDNACHVLSHHQFLDTISPIANFAVLVMEFASLYFLPGMVQVVICIVRILFHLTEVYLNGDVFWGMIFINAVLVAMNFKWIKNKAANLNFKALLPQAIIMLFIAVLNFSTPLYWFDVPVNNKYVISVTDDKDKNWILSPSFFGGYSSYFLYDVLVDFQPPGTPVLTYGVGETGNYDILHSLLQVKSVEELKKWNQESAEKADPNPNVKDFVVNLISKHIAKSCQQQMWPIFKIPRLFPHYLPRHYPESEARINSPKECVDLKIKKFQIDFQESIFLDGKIVRTREQTLFTKEL